MFSGLAMALALVATVTAVAILLYRCCLSGADAGNYDAGNYDAGNHDAGNYNAGNYDAGYYDAGNNGYYDAVSRADPPSTRTRAPRYRLKTKTARATTSYPSLFEQLYFGYD